MTMTTLNDYIAEQLKEPEFEKVWEDSKTEYQLRLAMIEARNQAGMTQADIAKATGMKQAAVSRLENGETNPTLRTIKRIAAATGKTLGVRFV